MSGFLSAHGYDPGPSQRPYLAGAIGGLVATLPASALLHWFGSLRVEAQILRVSVVDTLLLGGLVMACAGAVYARLFGRAANDIRGGCLFGMAFGFLLWSAGAVFVLPILSGGRAPAGLAALGVFLSFVVWGGAVGLLLPLIHPRLHEKLSDAARRPEAGPDAAIRRL